MSEQIPVKEISELLEAVTDKLPRLISSVMDNLYSAEAGKNIGQAIGNMYKELVASGVPEEAALKMSRDYLESLTNILDKIMQEQE